MVQIRIYKTFLKPPGTKIDRYDFKHEITNQLKRKQKFHENWKSEYISILKKFTPKLSKASKYNTYKFNHHMQNTRMAVKRLTKKLLTPSCLINNPGNNFSHVSSPSITIFHPILKNWPVRQRSGQMKNTIPDRLTTSES